MRTTIGRRGEAFARKLLGVLWEQRWLLLLVAGVWLIAVLASCCLTLSDGKGLASHATVARQVPVASLEQLPSHGWRIYLWHNLRVALRDFTLAIVSAGAGGVYASARDGLRTGATLADMVAVAAGHVAPTDVALGLLMPHALLGMPAFFLVWGLGLRCGLSWALPPRGRPRLGNLARQLRASGLCSVVIVPAFLLAGVLQDAVNPVFTDRYLLHLRTSEGLITEQRVGHPLESASSAWSRDGRFLALLDQSGCQLTVRDVTPGGSTWEVARSDVGFIMSSPSWSPDSKQLALVVRSSNVGQARGSGLLLVDSSDQSARRVPKGPAGVYLAAAWSPRDRQVTLIIGHVGETGTKSIDLWLLDPEAASWKRITHFRPSQRLAPFGLAWHPDGHELAFIHLREMSAPAGDDAFVSRAAVPRAALCTVQADGSQLREIAYLSSYTPLSWSPDGRWIAYLDCEGDSSDPFGAVSVVSECGRKVLSNLAPADRAASLQWSPDGRCLLYQRLATCIKGTLSDRALAVMADAREEEAR